MCCWVRGETQATAHHCLHTHKLIKEERAAKLSGQSVRKSFVIIYCELDKTDTAFINVLKEMWVCVRSSCQVLFFLASSELCEGHSGLRDTTQIQHRPQHEAANRSLAICLSLAIYLWFLVQRAEANQDKEGVGEDKQRGEVGSKLNKRRKLGRIPWFFSDSKT